MTRLEKFDYVVKVVTKCYNSKVTGNVPTANYRYFLGNIVIHQTFFVTNLHSEHKVNEDTLYFTNTYKEIGEVQRFQVTEDNFSKNEIKNSIVDLAYDTIKENPELML